MNLEVIENALLTVTDKVFHFRAGNQTDKYIIWAEDGQSDALWAENQMQNQTIEGTIDYFTKSENDANVGKIQKALNDAEIFWRLNSIQYEDDSKFVHYEWLWRVVM